MPKIVKPLTDTQIKNAKPKEKAYKLSDGKGLYLIVEPNSRKWWRFEYTWLGKRTSTSFGNYPETTLKKAREERDRWRRLLTEGKDPKLVKKDKYTLEEITLDYLKLQSKVKMQRKTMEGYVNRLKLHVFPHIGRKNINSITREDIIAIVQRIERENLHETNRRIYSILERVFRYAVTVGIAERNILAEMDKSLLLQPRRHKNYAHIENIDELRAYLKAVEEFKGYVATRQALKLLPYVFVRPSNIRLAEWSEFDFESKLWTIPAEKMKMKKPHIVPLTDSMIEIIRYMEPISKGVSKYVFVSGQTNMKPLSDNTLNQALKRMGFDITSHGFRHTASTILHENMHIHGVSSDAIEAQMAHVVGGSVKRVYNKALYIKERRRLMQWWSDFLDDLKRDNNTA